MESNKDVLAGLNQIDEKLKQADHQMQTAPDDDAWVENYLIWLELHALKWGYSAGSPKDGQSQSV